MPESSSNWLGRKGRDFFRRRPYPITGEHVGILNKPAYADASADRSQDYRPLRKR